MDKICIDARSNESCTQHSDHVIEFRINSKTSIVPPSIADQETFRVSSNLDKTSKPRSHVQALSGKPHPNTRLECQARSLTHFLVAALIAASVLAQFFLHFEDGYPLALLVLSGSIPAVLAAAARSWRAILLGEEPIQKLK